MSEVKRYTTEDIAEMRVDPGFVFASDYEALEKILKKNCLTMVKAAEMVLKEGKTWKLRRD